MMLDLSKSSISDKYQRFQNCLGKTKQHSSLARHPSTLTLAKTRSGGRVFLNFADLFSFLLYGPVVKNALIELLSCVTDYL